MSSEKRGHSSYSVSIGQVEAALGLPDEPARAALRQLPKTDLHAHSLLSMPLAAVETLAGGPIRPPPGRFRAFSEFTRYNRDVLFPHIRGLDAVRTLTAAALDLLCSEGVVYTEISVDLLVPRFLGFSMGEYASMLLEERDRRLPDLRVCLEGGLNREFPVEDLQAVLAEALELDFLGSIDLYGDEKAAPASDFVRPYEMAREAGLKLKAHTGELCGADSVRESVRTLGLDAVQHGITAAGDGDVLSFLAGEGVVLNVCPTSNVRLGLVPSLEEYPLKRLLDAGVRATVNSDDYTIFGATVTDELLGLHRAGAATPAEVARLMGTGLAQMPRARTPEEPVGGPSQAHASRLVDRDS